MATDATGSPTPKGIPKYNPSVDAPSGLGFNATMDAIDTLLDSYTNKPTGIVSGEVPVWNGSTWVRSSVTRINTVRTQDLVGDAWTEYTPALTGSTTNPTQGTGGASSGRFIQIGKIVVGSVRWVAGTAGFVNGAGSVRASLPVAMTTAMLSLAPHIGSGTYIDVSPANVYILSVTPQAASVVEFRAQQPVFNLSYTAPQTWAASDELSFNFTYEAA